MMFQLDILMWTEQGMLMSVKAPSMGVFIQAIILSHG